MFYPDDPEELRVMVDTLIAGAHPDPLTGKIISLILPHAGYPYSGQTAAFGYKLLSAQPPDTVVIISPSHREYFKGISIYDGDELQTPLGNLRVDIQLRDRIIAHRAAHHRGRNRTSPRTRGGSSSAVSPATSFQAGSSADRHG